jgi:hypothetical protein
MFILFIPYDNRIAFIYLFIYIFILKLTNIIFVYTYGLQRVALIYIYIVERLNQAN